MHFCFKTLYFQPFPYCITMIVFQLITTDAGIIELGADVYYKVTDAVKSVTNVQDMNATLRALVRNGVMNSLTRHELQYIEAQDLELMQNVRVRRVITDSLLVNKLLQHHRVSLSLITYDIYYH